LKNVDYLLVSHDHPDHIPGMRTFVEVMTYGGYVKRGTIISNSTVRDSLGDYHSSLVKNYYVLRKEGKVDSEGFEIKATPCIHPEKEGIDETVGFRIKTKLHNRDFVISYTSDTSLYKDGRINKELIESHKGANILMVNFCLPYYSMDIPRVAKILKKHLCLPGACTLGREVKPDILFLTHPCRISCDSEIKKKSLETIKKVIDIPVFFEECGMRLVINENNYIVLDSSSRELAMISRTS